MRVSRKWMLIAASAVPAMAMAADTVTLTAGRWEVTTKLTKATIGGVAIPVASFGKYTKVDYACVTAAEAANAYTHFLGKEAGDQCTPTGTAINGKINASADCDSQGGTYPSKIDLVGTYARQAYDLDARTSMSSDRQQQDIEAHISGRFVGACRGDEK